MAIRIIRQAAVRRPPETLRDIADLLAKDGTLADNRRRDLISAINSTARLAGRKSADIPADISVLRNLFMAFHPVQGRVSTKRLSNIRADLTAALQRAGVVPAPDPEVGPTVAWQEFRDCATAKHQAWFLSRFARYCSRRQIGPANVNDAIVREFHAWLSARILTNDPQKIVKSSATSFNAIVKRNNLDIPLLATAFGKRHVNRRFDMYPASLLTDIERYLKRLREPDLFSQAGPRRPLRPTSLRNIQAHIRQILDAAVQTGCPPAQFKTLADLINLEVIDAATGYMIKRRGGTIPAGLGNILATLLAIARYYVEADIKIVRKLENAKARVGDELGNRRPSMSLKSQRRMDQFEREENVVRLVNLPPRLIDRADRNVGMHSAALDAMVAAAIAVLLSCPMRMSNLANMHMKQDMTQLKEGRNTSFLIHIATGKTKGRQAIDAKIEPPFSTVISRYVNNHRNQFVRHPSDCLFPNSTGGPRLPKHFGEMIKKYIFRETGIVMNPHLFRHFAAHLFLRAHPGGYEDVRRVVGHAKLDTTTSFYSPTSNKSSFRYYGEVVGGYLTRESRK